VKPCLADAPVEAVRSIPIPHPASKDLLLVARDRVGIHDVLQRFGITAANGEIRLDRRRGERRRGVSRRRSAFKGRLERLRADRRAFDVNHQLQRNGWAFIAAIHRS
jgi:hypothetical protein